MELDTERKQLHLPVKLKEEIEILAIQDKTISRANDLYVKLLQMGLRNYKLKEEKKMIIKTKEDVKYFIENFSKISYGAGDIDYITFPDKNLDMEGSTKIELEDGQFYTSSFGEGWHDQVREPISKKSLEELVWEYRTVINTQLQWV